MSLQNLSPTFLARVQQLGVKIIYCSQAALLAETKELHIKLRAELHEDLDLIIDQYIRDSHGANTGSNSR